MYDHLANNSGSTVYFNSGSIFSLLGWDRYTAAANTYCVTLRAHKVKLVINVKLVS